MSNILGSLHQANYILYKHKLANFFIENMLSCKKNSRLLARFSDEDDEDITDVGESFYLSKAIEEIDDQSALIKLGNDLLINQKKDNDLFNDWFTAIEKISLLDSDLKNFLVKAFVEGEKKFCFRKNGKRLRKLIADHGLSTLCYEKIIATDLAIWLQIDAICKIYADELFFKIAELLGKQENKKFVVNRFVETLRVFFKNARKVEAQLLKLGYKYVPEESYEIVRIRKNQSEWNDLFDVKKIKQNIISIFELCKKESVTWEDVSDLEYEACNNYPHFAVMFFNNDSTYTKDQLINLDISIHWQICQIYECLKNNKEIVINKEQKSFVNNWCDRQKDKIDFKLSIEYNDDGGWSTTWDAVYFAFFIRKFDFSYNIAIYQSMTCFDYLENSDRSPVLKYLETRLGIKGVCSAIIKNMNEGFLKGFFLDSRLNYLLDQNNDGGKNFILEQLQQFDKINSSNYCTIISYIMQFNFEEDALVFYDSFNLEFKKQLITALIEKKEYVLALEYGEPEINKSDANAIDFAKVLIGINSKKALEYYFFWGKEHESDIEKDSYFDSVKIESVTDFHCVDLLIKILEFSYTIKTRHNFMQSGINSALNAIAIQSLPNLQYIVNKLSEVALKYELKNANYQHYYIDKMIKDFLWKSNIA